MCISAVFITGSSLGLVNRKSNVVTVRTPIKKYVVDLNYDEDAVDVKAVAAPAGAFVVDTDIDEVALKIAVTKA